ncbi:MAG: hypothetical protein EOS63_05530 [Mesorhizobium sp.]|uniref:phage late control D family protein n=1 Tax=Mesorhizobium sp. TaxID=1871066 RepID=UPI000FE75319|nr:contractile injection system protein, VgrG/Pvc8 family [Mesorhizobium sp.]RWE83148.1 MAG: hypothetical protein EOS63_05530 [Mesorhizobium sp.]TJW60707.1 MAG: hypothetical protein E5V97_23280 [Mesorhizobium sp.]
MRKGHLRVVVGGQDVTSRFLPLLISLSITKSGTEATQSATFTLDDKDATVRFPKTGTPVSIELGWQGGAMRTFEGEVDTCDWSTDRGSGSVLSVTARSASLKGKVKQPADRHWEKKKLGQVLDDAAQDAGLSIKVHPSLASRELEYEAQDNESFLAFADRLAREHGATFAIKGTQAGFVPRNAGVSATGQPLPTIVITRGMVISASGLTPVTDRPRFKKKKGRWYDIKRAKQVIEEVETGDDVEPEDVLRFMEPDETSAKTRADSDRVDGARSKGSGSVTIEGEPTAEPEGTAIIDLRAGVDGSYTIASITDTLDRGSGYTTQISLGNPQGSAGADRR